MSYLSTLAARALDQPQPIRPRLPSLFEPIAGPRVNFREVTPNKRNKQEPRQPPRDAEQSGVSQNSKSRTSSIRPKAVFSSAEALSRQTERDRQSIKSFSESVQPSAEPKHVDERSADRISEKRGIETANEKAADNPRVAAATSSSDKTADNPRVAAATSSSDGATKPNVQIAQAVTIEQTNVIEAERDARSQPETHETKSQQPDAPRAQSIVLKPDVTTDRSESVFIEPQIVAPDSPRSVKITIGRVDVRAIMPPAQSTVIVARQPAMKALSLDEYLKQRNGEQR